MSISRAGFARGEAIAVLPRLPFSALAALSLAALFALSGCTSPHPAPIVHRESRPPVAVQPPVPAPAPAAPASAAATSPPDAGAAEGVQTTPIARGPVETRPLPGAAGAAAETPGAASANLLKTGPKALKQPYSDAALAQMRADAASAAQSMSPAAQPIPPVASAAPSAADAARTPAPAPVAPPAAADADWIWPASGQVVQDFAQPSSMGISIAGKPGDPVVAVHDGRVIFSGAGPRSYGNLVIVKHGDDTLSVYAHNRALLVKEGQSVKRGQRIAELGSSGTDSPKLHFEIRKDGRPIDPRKVLPAR